MKKKKFKNKISFKLFYNDKFVMFFSILVAFIAWLFVASTSEDAATITITDIPISLPELSDSLKYFGTDDLTASVRISGNAIVITTVTKDDIYITANDTSQITKPDTYKIDLIPKKSGIKTDYSFDTNVSPSSIDVFVDYFEEREFPITTNINLNNMVSSGYSAGQAVLSQQKVKVSGARSVLDKIAEVDAEYTFQSTLTQTTVVKAPLVFRDSNKKEIDLTYISGDISEVDVTIQIMAIKTLPIKPQLLNLPDTLELSDDFITIDPKEINIGIPTNATLNEIWTAPIDFLTITPDNSEITTELNIPSGYKNLDGITSVTVSFDVSNMITRRIKVTDFTIKNQGKDQSVSVATKSIEVTVMGPKTYVNRINSENLDAVVDVSEQSTMTNGTVELPVKITLGSSFGNCWVQGSYTVNVTFSEKSESSKAESSE